MNIVDKGTGLHQTVIDQMGRIVTLSVRPRRIISLVPSQTELLFDLGLEQEIVGITRFCIHPEEKVSQKERIGGTKNFDFEKIKSLHPDLIIGNKEENYEDGINELQRLFPLWMSDIGTLDDAYQMMSSVGQITGREDRAREIVTEIKSNFREISNQYQPSMTCAYFIWRRPYMVAALGTFIDHMLGILGLKNVYADLNRYPEIRADDIAARRPDFIFLSSEPYSFRERHIDEFQSMCPDAMIKIVDGELFSWYGSRLRYTAPYFTSLKGSITL